MNLNEIYDTIANTIRSLNGVRTALLQLSLNEEDPNNDFFTLLHDEIMRDINVLDKLNDAVYDEAHETENE